MSAEDITEEPCIDDDHENDDGESDDDVQVSTLCVLQTFEDDILSDAFSNFSLLELCASDGR